MPAETLTSLKGMSYPELKYQAKERGIQIRHKKKKDLIQEIFDVDNVPEVDKNDPDWDVTRQSIKGPSKLSNRALWFDYPGSKFQVRYRAAHLYDNKNVIGVMDGDTSDVIAVFNRKGREDVAGNHREYPFRLHAKEFTDVMNAKHSI